MKKTKTAERDKNGSRVLESVEQPSSQRRSDAALEVVREPSPEPYEQIGVPIDSLEASVGYSSLMRQMHRAFIRMVAFYRSKGGGSLSVEEARKRAFHAPVNETEVDELFSRMMSLPVENLCFVDLQELQAAAPRTAEAFWETVKAEARMEFESGHFAANSTFPIGYMKDVWNIAKYLGLRESFAAEWQPKGGIELGLVDMMAQCYFQWQFWLEQTVKRSETREREEHPEYTAWKDARRTTPGEAKNWDGHWIRPTVSEVQAIEHAVQMADRWNRMFMRTLRQLRDLRRYTSVNITNNGQVNIATDGGQQVNQADSP